MGAGVLGAEVVEAEVVGAVEAEAVGAVEAEAVEVVEAAAVGVVESEGVEVAAEVVGVSEGGFLKPLGR